MPPRHRKGLSENTRKRIQAASLIDLVQAFALGNPTYRGQPTPDLTRERLVAIKMLLDKVLPDVRAIEFSGEIRERAVVSARTMDATEWEQQYARSLGAPAGTTESTH